MKVIFTVQVGALRAILRGFGPWFLVAAIVVAAFTGCATSSAPPATSTVAGRAFLETTSPKEQRQGIEGTVVSINGQSIKPRTEAHLPPGPNDVAVRLNWPKGEGREVDLNFEARYGQRYFLKYALFPPSSGHPLDESYEGSVVAERGMGALRRADLGYGGAFLGIPVLAVGVGEFGYRVAGAIVPRQPKGVRYVDVFVISTDIREGVVHRVRVHADGEPAVAEMLTAN